MADCDAVTNRIEKPTLLLALEMTLPKWLSSFVFAKHEATHEYGTEHDDETEKV